MDNKLQIRLSIGDQLQSKLQWFNVNANQTSFPLKHSGINSILFVKKNGVALNTSDYTLIDNVLSVSATLATNDKLEVAYKFSCLTDSELDFALSNSNNDVVSASIQCIDWLLADAAKLFNYSTGDESMSQEAVFDHLLEIKKQLKENSKIAGGAVPRIYDFKKNEPKAGYHDISRDDIGGWR